MEAVSFAMVDSLTSLPLPRAFIRDLEGYFNDARHSVTVLIADFDHFRDVNNKHGVVVGDEVLQGLVSLFSKCCAALPEALCYRYGGSVFDVILAGHDLQNVRAFAEFIRTEVEGLRHNDVALTVSIGMATGSAGWPCGSRVNRSGLRGIARCEKEWAKPCRGFLARLRTLSLAERAVA